MKRTIILAAIFLCAGVSVFCLMALPTFFQASASSVTVDDYNHTSVIHWKTSDYAKGLEKVNEYVDKGYFISGMSNNHQDIFVMLDNKTYGQ